MGREHEHMHLEKLTNLGALPAPMTFSLWPCCSSSGTGAQDGFGRWRSSRRAILLGGHHDVGGEDVFNPCCPVGNCYAGLALLSCVRALGLWGMTLSLAAAHSLGSLLVVFLVVRAALADVEADLELAARGLGAGPWQTFWQVTLPVILPALVVGALIAFILSLNEFMLALFLSIPAIETLPKVIWPNLRYTLTPLVAAASGVTMAFTLLGLGVVAWLLRVERVLRGV